MSPSPTPTDAEFVKDAREQLGLTQAEFGEKIGRDRRTIVRYEQGEPVPTPTRLAITHLLALEPTIPTKPKAKNSNSNSRQQHKRRRSDAKAVRHRR